MRKILLLISICVLISAPALAGGGKDSQNRQGMVDFNSGICKNVKASAIVHANGARFTVKARGCTPGDVMTIWGFAGPLESMNPPIILNCGGGIALPNGKFNAICDIPRGLIAACMDCAQVLVPGIIGEPRNMDFAIDMLTHDDLKPDISMSQLRTLYTCDVPDDEIDGPDSCARVAFLSFPAP